MIRIIIGSILTLLLLFLASLGVILQQPNTIGAIITGVFVVIVAMVPGLCILAWGIVSRHNSKKQLEGVK